MAGLARAGVVGRWTVPVMFLPMIVPGIAAGTLTGAVGAVVAAAIGLLLWAPLALVGLRLVRRPALPVA